MKILALFLCCFIISACGFSVVDPGNRGVVVSWGQVQEPVRKEGFQTYCFLGCSLTEVSVRQQKRDLDAPCFSSDLQQVDLKVTVLYSIPEASVAKIFRDFNGEPFDVLLAPRVYESIKEVTSSRSAEMIVKEREAVKTLALNSIRLKLGDLLVVDDIVVSDIKLSQQLMNSIESKMIQEQEAAKAKYTKAKAEIDAETAVATARGEAESSLTRARAEAESIRIRGLALQEHPGVIQLQLIERWNGVSPQIVAGSSGVNVIMPAAK